MRTDREWYPRDDALDAPGVVEALVAEAEEGYERLGAEFVSRPPDEEIEALRRIVFRVPVNVRKAAQRRADEEGRALSDLAAEALREYLKAARRKSRGVKKTSNDS
jgi:hypothetical protein